MIPALFLLFAASTADRLIDAALSAEAQSEYIAVEGCRVAPAFENISYHALADRSFICRSESDGVVIERHFYVTENGTRGQYVHAWATVSDPATIEKVRHSLTRRYGKPREVRNIAEIGVYGVPAERWSTDHAQLILHDQQHRAGGVQLIGIAHDRWELSLEDDLPVARPSNELLKEALPQYATLFDIDWQKPIEPLLTAARKLLTEARNAQPERAALLLVTGDVLADGLAGMAAEPRTDRADVVRRTLGPFGIQIGEQTHYAGLEYRWEPLWRAAELYPESEWGQIAFSRLLQLGWPKGESTGAICPRSDVFARVIASGEKWLGEHSVSSRRHEVLFHVARAYETWWSAVRAPKEDIRVHDQFGPVRPKYVKGAPEALRKAIAYYEELVRLAPGSEEARQAQRHLPRLQRGIDTGQRVFLCTMC